MVEPQLDQRPDFYITPRPILRQRIELQRARIEQEYGRLPEAVAILSRLIVSP